MEQPDYCRSSQTGDTQRGRPASGLGAKGKRRIHLGSLGVRVAAQICPVLSKVRPQVFARNACHALNISASLRRNLAIAGHPLMHCRRFDVYRSSKRRKPASNSACLFDR